MKQKLSRNINEKFSQLLEMKTQLEKEINKLEKIKQKYQENVDAQLKNIELIDFNINKAVAALNHLNDSLSDPQKLEDSKNFELPKI